MLAAGPGPELRKQAAPHPWARPKKAGAIGASELVALRISCATIRNGLVEGALPSTQERGVYRRTQEMRGRLDACLSRRGRAPTTRPQGLTSDA